MLLTRLPVPRGLQPGSEPDAALLADSATLYPLVGALLGALLWLAAVLALILLPPLASAAVVLALWAYLTGALHLDGLADCVDGLAAAHGNPTRLREAMKDSRIGAMGAVALNIALLLKLALLVAVLTAGAAAALIVIALLARLAALVCLQITPYSQVGGPAAEGKSGALMLLVWGVVGWLGCALVGGWPLAVMAFAAGAVWLWYWRRMWCRALGGYSGDTLGGLIETTEIILLGVVCIGW